MAILNRIACIPSALERESLTNIEGNIEIWKQEIVPGGYPRVLSLIDPSTQLGVCIRSDYRDVQFKFECLYLTINEEPITDKLKGTKVGELNIAHVKSVLRAEWLCPASGGAVPEHSDQVFQKRGKPEECPSGVSGCISMVGVLMVDREGETQGLIYLDDDFPLSLSFTQDKLQIENICLDSTSVAFSEMEKAVARFTS